MKKLNDELHNGAHSVGCMLDQTNMIYVAVLLSECVAPVMRKVSGMNGALSLSLSLSRMASICIGNQLTVSRLLMILHLLRVTNFLHSI